VVGIHQALDDLVASRLPGAGHQAMLAVDGHAAARASEVPVVAVFGGSVRYGRQHGADGVRRRCGLLAIGLGRRPPEELHLTELDGDVLHGPGQTQLHEARKPADLEAELMLLLDPRGALVGGIPKRRELVAVETTGHLGGGDVAGRGGPGPQDHAVDELLRAQIEDDVGLGAEHPPRGLRGLPAGLAIGEDPRVRVTLRRGLEVAVREHRQTLHLLEVLLHDLSDLDIRQAHAEPELAPEVREVAAVRGLQVELAIQPHLDAAPIDLGLQRHPLADGGGLRLLGLDELDKLRIERPGVDLLHVQLARRGPQVHPVVAAAVPAALLTQEQTEA